LSLSRNNDAKAINLELRYLEALDSKCCDGRMRNQGAEDDDEEEKQATVLTCDSNKKQESNLLLDFPCSLLWISRQSRGDVDDRRE
jgi:hypothetical protein